MRRSSAASGDRGEVLQAQGEGAAECGPGKCEGAEGKHGERWFKSTGLWSCEGCDSLRGLEGWHVREVEPEPSARLCLGTANPSEGPMRAMREAEIPHNLDHEERLELTRMCHQLMRIRQTTRVTDGGASRRRTCTEGRNLLSSRMPLKLCPLVTSGIITRSTSMEAKLPPVMHPHSRSRLASICGACWHRPLEGDWDSK
jgi:hypothetical protein